MGLLRLLKSLVLCGFFDEAESILRSVKGEKERDTDRDTGRKGWCGKWLGGNKEGDRALDTDSAVAVDCSFHPQCSRGAGVFLPSAVAIKRLAAVPQFLLRTAHKWH